MLAKTIAIVSVSACFTPLLLPQDAGKGDGERLKRLIPAAIQKVEVHPELTALPTAKLVARSGLDSTTMPSLRRYRAHVAGDPRPTEAAFLDLTLRGKKYRLGAAVSPEKGVLGPTLFDDFGKPVADLDRFLSQFKGEGAVRLTDASREPVGDAVKLRDEVLSQDEPPAKKDARTRWVLLRHHLAMRAVAEHDGRVQEAAQSGEALAGPLRELLASMEQLREFSAHLKLVFEPKEVGQYRAFTDEGHALAVKAQALAEEGKREEALAVVRGDLAMSCGRCHGWQENHWKKPLGEAMRAQLEQAGFKHGYFVVDMDVRRVDLDAESAQQVASAVKAALLLAHGAVD
ncbi:MAG: hypothetical protein HY812_12850 [Planctomycetes bacterium]|nr:hypothetical protein [Planctomycetota bacterium]